MRSAQLMPACLYGPCHLPATCLPTCLPVDLKRRCQAVLAAAYELDLHKLEVAHVVRGKPATTLTPLEKPAVFDGVLLALDQALRAG